MPLPLETVERALHASLARAQELDIRIAVAIVDESGIVQALARADGAAPLSARIAGAKASTCALWHRDGDRVAETSNRAPGFIEAVGRLTLLPIVPVDGSVLIRSAAAVVGAIGVSGGTASEDRACADAGLSAIG